MICQYELNHGRVCSFYQKKMRRQFDSHSLSKGGGGGYFLVAFDVRRKRPNLNARSLGTSI